MKRRILAGLLSLSLLMGMESVSVFGENISNYNDNLCAHHTEHDESCGYTAGVEGSCSFECQECADSASESTQSSSGSVSSSSESVDGSETNNEGNETETNQGSTQDTSGSVDSSSSEVTSASSTSETSETSATSETSETSEVDESEIMAAALELGLGPEDAAHEDLDWQVLIRPDVKYPRSDFDSHKVTAVQPANVTVNLFDYWTETQKATDTRDDRSIGAGGGVNGQGKNGDPWQLNYKYFLNKESINYGHAFLFGGSNIDNTTNLNDRGNWRFGKTFNAYTGNGKTIDSKGEIDENGKRYLALDGVTKKYGGPQQGIVGRTLGADGYPHLNLTQDDVETSLAKPLAAGYYKDGIPSGQESLAYLFDPTNTNNGKGKASYTNVEGLFQINDAGNYYYDSNQNYASLNTENGKNTFDLYDTKGVVADNRGNFFPFNEPGSVFKLNDKGEMVDNRSRSDGNNRVKELNHYFGLTMETEFMQPRGGLVSSGSEKNTPMTFEFFGDDDIWIYIDGVLVSDLGGIHDYCYTKIDFSTGEIIVLRNETDMVNYKESHVIQETTIKEQFELAGKYNPSDFKGDTFRDNSLHKMNVYYLERGNTDSNLRLEFNMISPRSGQIIKVNQDGKALNGAEFALYEANVDESGKWTATGTSLGNFISGIDGTVVLEGEDGEPVDFDANKKYILREVTTPDGYVTTGDIHLTFDQLTSMLEVDNKWTTGAVASFEAQVHQAGKLLYYSDKGEGKGEAVDNATGQAGLIIAVPFFSPEGETSETREGWEPMYGSVSEGFHTVHPTSYADETAVRTAALEAALRQISDSKNERWYLEWHRKNQRYEGDLVDLPGSVDRYLYNNTTDGDMNVAYYLLNLSAFGIEDAENMTTVQKYEALIAALGNRNVREFAAENSSTENIRLLDISRFNRQFYTRLYIPNQARKFEVLKQDEEGKPLPDAEFTLYESEDCEEGTEVAKGKTDANGKLSFSVENPEENGNGLDGNLSSEVYFPLGRKKTLDGQILSRSYWLKETKAPDGYGLNNSVIEVRVTSDSTYIYAGEEGKDDGVKVRKGLSVLLQTVVRYAASSEIDVTLRDVTLQKYLNTEAKSGVDITAFGSNDWIKDENASINLHYGLEGRDEGFDYGIHKDENPNEVPYYETEYGWLGYGVVQNYTAHDGDSYDKGGRKTNLSELGVGDISALFPDTTQVVVTDKMSGNITIQKNGEIGDSDADTALSDAEFKIQKLINTAAAGEEAKWEVDTSSETGCTKTVTTGTDGKASVTDLPYGRYRITETKAPEGYQVATESIDVTIDATTFTNPPEDTDTMSYDSTTNTVNITVHDDRMTNISLVKVNADNPAELLEGAKFKLEKLKNTAGEGETANWIVDDSFEKREATTKDGKISFDGLLYGTYSLTEIVAPSGYQLLEAPIQVTISKDKFVNPQEEISDSYKITYDNNSKTISVEAYDKKLANIAIIKKGKAAAGETAPLLKDAEFKLEKLIVGETDKEAEWEVDTTFEINNQTTGEDGSAKFTGLSNGTYRITEVKSPSGYILLKKPVYVTLSDEAFKAQADEHKDDPNYNASLRTITVTIENEKGLSIPGTGGNGSLPFVIFGLTIISAAALLIYRNSIRNKRHNKNRK